MSGHTPGPWKAVRVPQSRCYRIDSALVDDVRWQELATVYENDAPGLNKQARGNANLIAAAPELLEALDAAMRNGDHTESCPAQPNVCTCWRALARAAIAKATGGIP